MRCYWADAAQMGGREKSVTVRFIACGKTAPRSFAARRPHPSA